MLRGRKIVLGVTGGIAAYKACALTSLLVKNGAEVDVIMTKNAMQFVSPLTFETLSNRPVITDTFERSHPWEVEHVALAKKADLFVVAPATANFIGKYAHGIADDMLTTTVMATKAKVLVVPAMNTAMYESPAVTDNISLLQSRGVSVMETASGRLACGDTGKGKLPEPEDIFNEIRYQLCDKKDLVGRRFLLTAGATIEKLDAVRFITNFSSGRMGLAIAEKARMRGAEVTVVLGRHSVEPPKGVKVINVSTTQEMHDAVISELENNDVIIKAAAPCDYKPAVYSENKIKSQSLHLDFVKNVDIAAAVGKVKGDRKLVVFSAETENLYENAMGKLMKKGADMVVANDVTEKGAGFNTATNRVTIINRKGETKQTGLLDKSEVADIILDSIVELG